MNNRGRPKVLIIDDEIAFRIIYGDMLQKEGFEVLQARNGDEGFELAKLRRPDLVMLDIAMPNMNGIDVLKKLRSHPKTQSIKVVIFSILGEEEEIAEGLRAGADDYFVKGVFAIKDISRKMYALLGKKGGRLDSLQGYLPSQST